MHARAVELKVGGFTPLTSTDYPGHLAAVVFCQGCPWRCGYCHNPHLQAVHADALVSWQTVRKFLLRRSGLLDGVVFSGGEPTIQRGLAEAMRDARQLGFKVALHTAGPMPSRLRRLLPEADWIGMDIKADFADYPGVTGVPCSGDKAMESARMIVASRVDHEFRTTVHPALISRAQLQALAKRLADMGVRNYVLQEFRQIGCTAAGLSALAGHSYLDPEFCAAIGALFETFSVRRA